LTPASQIADLELLLSRTSAALGSAGEWAVTSV
jgi:hypothetical protein